MAKRSVQKSSSEETDALHAIDAVVSHPSFIYSETDPFERAWARLKGLEALETISCIARESERTPSDCVWDELSFLIEQILGDIRRDIYEFRQDTLREVV